MGAPSSRSAASLINPFLAQRYSVLLEFPVSGVVDAQPFSCPSLGISSSRCMFNTDARIFTNALITARPETGVPLNYSTSPCGKGDCPAIGMASSLRNFLVMVWICQHCFAPFVDSLYRVKSEESGVVFLDLIVCHGCYVQARELGLLTEKIGVGYRSPAETTAAQEKKPTLRRRATERRESRR